MARYTGPKNRLARRENMDLGTKTVGSKSHANLLKRLNIPPGFHGAKGRTKQSNFGLQLREKQKVKRMYGVLERQTRRMFTLAKKWKGNTGEKFLEFMERRLDNVLYRMSMAPTRNMARQLVNHGHVFVNNKKVSIASYQIKQDDVITYSAKALNIPAVKAITDDKNPKLPEWVERKGPVGKIIRLPVRTDINEDINEQLIVEHYSR